ncbi:hypothetical protein Q9295_10235 [Xinfangfangia sp. CPCC 101601]|uniref:Uncharacterized protein n=1 Tax=Pseudogemmobacter lacusdianii TaxID=3069608 RepID=A0ABU0VYC8_9RHOB|nr:hypothetical protein [Xinfangfangia sp. CPCC 101601]MDQ2066756.1 hypothetical protein [Xinfangfangia sp. CPCC 101601]
MRQQLLEEKIKRINKIAKEALTKPDGARVDALMQILKLADRESPIPGWSQH